MVDIVVITELDFATGWWLDWGQDPQAGAALPLRRCPVGNILGLRSRPLQAGPGRPPLDYSLPGMRVTVSGRQIDLQFCGITFNSNHCTHDGLLVAPCGRATVDHAPLAIGFAPGVAAVGSFIAAGSFAAPVGARFAARLWVRLAGNQTFQAAVTATGETGVPLPAAPRAAPFLGACDRHGGRIVEARFDLAPIGPDPVDQIALAQLYALD